MKTEVRDQKSEVAACGSWRDRILLEQSGELGRFGAFLLKRHLASCADCRAYREDLGRITMTAREIPDDVDAAVVQRVRAAARAGTGRGVEIRLRPAPLPASWRPALVYSAISVLALAGFWLVIRPALSPSNRPASPASVAAAEYRWDDDFDSQIEEVRSLLVSASATDTSEPEDVGAIAEELLKLEERI